MNVTATVITALKTPFMATGKIDFTAFEQLLRRQMISGIRGFVVGGTTGDGCFLSEEDQLELIRLTRSVAGNDTLVIGATSSLSTREMIKRTTCGFEAGMSASLQLPPYYIRPGSKGVVEHLEAALEIGPGIIYNVPARTGVDINVEEILELAPHKNFLGVKECTGLERSALLQSKGIRVWSGNDATAAEEIRSDVAFGVISVVSNIAPQLACLLFSNERKTSTAPLETLITQLGKTPNPVGITTVMAMVGLINPILWRPYQAIPEIQQEEMIPTLNQLVAHERAFKPPQVMQKEGWIFI